MSFLRKLPFLFFLVVEAVFVLVGVGCVVSLLIRRGSPPLPDLGLLLDFGIVGLIVGALLARLTARFFDAPTTNMGWVWAYTLLGGWLLGGGAYFLKASGVITDMTLVWLATAFGTLPGMGAGFLLSAINPAFRHSRITAPNYDPFDGFAAAPMPPSVPRTPPRSEAARREALMETLLDEIKDLESAYPESEGKLFELTNGNLALTFAKPSYLGLVTYYIVCPLDYPDAAPDEVYMEVYDPSQPSPVRRRIDYDAQALAHWDRESGNASLGMIVHDGFLQVEDLMLT